MHAAIVGKQGLTSIPISRGVKHGLAQLGHLIAFLRWLVVAHVPRVFDAGGERATAPSCLAGLNGRPFEQAAVRRLSRLLKCAARGFAACVKTGFGLAETASAGSRPTSTRLHPASRMSDSFSRFDIDLISTSRLRAR